MLSERLQNVGDYRAPSTGRAIVVRVVALVCLGLVISSPAQALSAEVGTPVMADAINGASDSAGQPSVELASVFPSHSESNGPTGFTQVAPIKPVSDDEAHDIVVVARTRDIPGDPFQEINAKSFAAIQATDEALLAPIAKGYTRALPGPVRSGLRNFLYNLREPVVFLNFLLQLNPGKAAETLGRFAINSTVGVAGLVDVAKRHPFRLPRRANGFADTMGFYGIKPGPFMFVPLIGPTTVRDLIGNIIDRLVLPLGVGKPFNRRAYTIPATAIGAIDHRVEFDEKLEELRAAVDPYVAARTYYLQRRQAEIDELRHSGPQRPRR